MKNLCYFIILIVLLISCCPNLDTTPYKVEFQRVFLNESNRFTFIVDGVPREIMVWYTSHIKIFYDVPPGEPMYYESQKKCKQGNVKYEYLYIHIHSVKDIGGGGWNHGKFGRGNTSVLE